MNDIDLRDLDDNIYRSLLGITETDESIEVDVESKIDEETISVGRGNKRVTVQKAEYYQLISTNLVKNGKSSMVKVNIPRTWFRQKCRSKCQKNALRDALFNYVTKDRLYVDSHAYLQIIDNGNHTAMFSGFDSRGRKIESFPQHISLARTSVFIPYQDITHPHPHTHTYI